MAKDTAQLVLSMLQASSQISDLVTGGASNILESGDMLVSVLSAAEEARRAAGEPLVLGVSIQDAGESLLRGGLTRQSVVARVLDRRNGFEAIRTVRLALLSVLDGYVGALDNGGIVSLTYRGRSGHRVDRTYDVDFEAVSFDSTVESKEE